MATDIITVWGFPVRFMYRQYPDNDQDSGWRFMSGHEAGDYLDNSSNLGVYDVNTIANYDPSIIPLLNSPVKSVFEKRPGQETFTQVTDWEPADGW